MNRPAATVDLPSRAGTALLAVVLPAVVAVVTLVVVAGDTDAGGFAIAAAVGRAIMYVGVLLAAGGTAFLVLVHDRRPGDARALTRVVTLAALLGAAGTLVGIPIQAAEITGTGFAGMVDGEVLGHVLSSGFGNSALLRLTGLAILLVGVGRLWAPWANVVGLLGALAALASFLLTGHTATTEPRWLAVGANYVHTIAGASWFGGLALLALALRGRRSDEDANGGARMVARFSNLALGSVTVLLLAGTALAWAEVRSLAGLTATGYGWTLITKVTVVLVVVAMGGYNNLRLVPAVQRDTGDAWATLSRTVRAEAVGILAVLAVTAVLVNQEPARNFTPAEPVDAFADLGESHEVNLVVDPAQAGFNEIHLYLLDEGGSVADIGDEVTLHMQPPGDGGEPVRQEATPAGPGHYFHSGTEMSVPGDWTVEVEVEVPGSASPSAAFEVPVAEGGDGPATDPGQGHDHEETPPEDGDG